MMYVNLLWWLNSVQAEQFRGESCEIADQKATVTDRQEVGCAGNKQNEGTLNSNITALRHVRHT